LADVRAVIVRGLPYALGSHLPPDHPEFESLVDEVAQENCCACWTAWILLKSAASSPPGCTRSPSALHTLSCAGVPVYKSDWSDAQSVENALEHFLKIPERRKAGERPAPFQVERLDYRNQDREKFYQGLERNGPKAVDEVSQAVKYV